MRDYDQNGPEKNRKRKASVRAFEDLKGKLTKDALTYEIEMEFNLTAARRQKEKTSNTAEPPQKARLTIRNYRERRVKTGMSRAEE